MVNILRAVSPNICGVSLALLSCVAFASPALAQDEYPQKYTDEKEHCTFIAYLQTCPGNEGQFTKNRVNRDVFQSRVMNASAR